MPENNEIPARTESLVRSNLSNMDLSPEAAIERERLCDQFETDLNAGVIDFDSDEHLQQEKAMLEKLTLSLAKRHGLMP